MRLHRFYIDQNIGAQTELTINSAELVNQVRRVFRLKKGDSIIVFNGTGFDYICKIDGFGEKSTIDRDSNITPAAKEQLKRLESAGPTDCAADLATASANCDPIWCPE